MTEQTMPFWLKQRALLTPGRTAVVGDGEQVTFGELNQRARRLAYFLAGLGVRRGDHVALLMTNRLLTVELIHAISYLGAVIVPLNTRLTPAELAWQLNDVEASLLIYDTAYGDKVEQLKDEVSCQICADSQLDGVNAGQVDDHQVSLVEHIALDDVHTIIYTSGTTGRPKGTLLTFGNHWWSAIGSSLNLGLHADDRWLCCLPLFHVSGLSILMRSVICGMTVVLHDKFDPQRVNEAIGRDKVTIISVVTAMLTAMLDTLSTERYPEHLRCVLLGGGPAPLPLLKACVSRSIPVYQTYGLTETASQIVTLSPDDILAKVGSAGKPLFPAQLRIVSDGQEMGAGQIGEIIVKGPNVTKGYYKREDATAQAIQDGWLYTGDLGYVDEDGFLYVVDRRNDLIISGGENVYPAEVESALLAHPDVKEAGVTAAPDPKWGAVPVAFIVTREGATLTEAELVAYCTQRLARYKVPKKIYFVSQLPRNASNKLLRRELRSLVQQERQPGAQG
ncbi:O-succinylbenzoic acid--CoA ligase [Caldalkalibacillus uzonensis]|uniref:2-succinylbenzoate--CoA ligase n=1 Tax=Caldalkalibacillus uzonensis TaxID=353224 RepID=A0ABU0CMW3_9BACI|nr:o-succinylbenzoate--CoA ligase [Caldalkalibacillus uzonensis]MDQ0337497.1 O-succinylbenzoic acid--CoA ligase [Caldalkalibacillus uzonensis]